MLTSQVVFFYNKNLFAKAGVDGNAVKSWDDLLGAVKKLQAAGIVPIVAGGGDKWPLHFYWSHLAIRLGGKPAFDAAMAGQGFAGETFVKSGELFKQLVDLKPFQPGFLGATYPQSAGQFGDGKGAMMLMLNGVLNTMRANAADKVGIPDEKLGWFAFPSVPGGKGTPELVKRPILMNLAGNVSRSRYHQLFYDQMLGPSVGAVVNDVSVELAGGRISPADAANKVQQAWLQAN